MENENLIARRKLLKAAIAERQPNIQKLKDEFNFHTKEVNRLRFELSQHEKAAAAKEFYFLKLQTKQLEEQNQLNEVNRQINEIPTIARYEKTNPVFKDFAKAVVMILIFLLPLITFAQPYVGMEAGNRMGINAGMIVHNIELKGGALFPYTRSTVISNITYAEIGYKFGSNFNLTPMAGISHYHNTVKGIQEINKTSLIASLEFGRDFTTAADHFGNYYLFASNAYKMFFGAGLKLYIK